MRPEVPLDPALRSIDLSTGPLFFTDTGSGRPVVGVHGMPATSRDFRWLDAAFDGRVRFLRLDLPGFGRSPQQTSNGETLNDLGAVVAELCEAVKLEDAILLGHSMGGAVVIDAATRSPRVAGIALVSSSGPIDHRGLFRRTYRVLERVIDLHPIVRGGILAVVKPIAWRVGFSKRLSDDELIWAARLCGRYRPDLLAEQLSGLDKPAFISWAEDDPSVELAVAEALLACARDPEQLRFATGGHNLQSTRATELADAIVAWEESLS